MTPEKGTTQEEFLATLRKAPEFRKQERLIEPFYRIALEIIKFRNMLGLTQKELAKRAGTHQARISKIESSELDIRLSTLTGIAEALNCQVVINLVPISEIPIYVKSDEPYRTLFATGIQVQPNHVSGYNVVGGQYEPVSMTEGEYGQCQ